MHQIVAITTVTMKRLMNCQRVIEKEADAANTRQWQKMTAENMRLYEAARKDAERLGAVVAYAGYLFRVQNNLASYRILPSEYRLHNELVDMMNALSIPVAMVAVDISEDDEACMGTTGKR